MLMDLRDRMVDSDMFDPVTDELNKIIDEYSKS